MEYHGKKKQPIETVRELKKFLNNYPDDTCLSCGYLRENGGGFTGDLYVFKDEPYRDSKIQLKFLTKEI